jgi:hypothetical protein
MRSGVFYAVRAEMLETGHLVESQFGAMSQLCDIRQPVRILAEDNVRVRYQETTSEDIEDFMSSAVTVIFKVSKPVRLLVTCSYELCVQVFNKSSHQSKPRI